MELPQGDNQRFRVYDAGGGYWQIQAKHSGMCLDVWGASTASGAQVRQGNCHSGNNQKLNPANHGSGGYQFGFKHSGICLDVNGASADNGAKIIQSYCHAGDNQRFFFERVE
ncbi:MAG: RICIN domain-containing protein [Hahellaceae bacterium]|nr:RICIN domain-containing protein [Hahellaceae bacterium]